MEQIKNLFSALGRHFEELARANAVVARPITVGERHVVPLCELGLVFGGGGGLGELKPTSPGEPPPTGLGGGAGGGAKAAPIAVLVVEGNKVRLDKIGE